MSHPPRINCTRLWGATCDAAELAISGKCWQLCASLPEPQQDQLIEEWGGGNPRKLAASLADHLCFRLLDLAVATPRTILHTLPGYAVSRADGLLAATRGLRQREEYPPFSRPFWEHVEQVIIPARIRIEDALEEPSYPDPDYGFADEQPRAPFNIYDWFNDQES